MSWMNRCLYKLPPNVTLEILNTCFALLTSFSEVVRAVTKCCTRLICFWFQQLTKKTVERSLTLCCSLSKICVFLFSSQRNDQRKVPKHLGEAQEVIYLFFFSWAKCLDFTVIAVVAFTSTLWACSDLHSQVQGLHSD